MNVLACLHAEIAAAPDGVLGLTCLAAAASARQGAPPEPDHPEMNQRAPDVAAFSSTRARGASFSSCSARGRRTGPTVSTISCGTGITTTLPSSVRARKRGSSSASAADPAVATVWRTRTIPDDPRHLSNTRGTVAYAFKDPNGRTTQMFINLKDNASTHDGEPFVPFARVIEGMDVAAALYVEHGEKRRRRHSGWQAGSALCRGKRLSPPRVPQARLHQARDRLPLIPPSVPYPTITSTDWIRARPRVVYPAHRRTLAARRATAHAGCQVPFGLWEEDSHDPSAAGCCCRLPPCL